MFDEVHAETVVVFDLHAIENATVGVDPNEKLVLWLKIV